MLIKKFSEDYIIKLANVVDEYREFCGFNKSNDETIKFFQYLLTNNAATTFIALNAEDEIMGFINLYPSYSTLSLKKIFILNDLGVSSQFRRLGVAKALITEAMAFAKVSGAIRVELKTDNNNNNAKKLYSELGFEIDKENIYYKVPFK